MLNRNQEHSAELRRRVWRSSRGRGVSIALAGLLALGTFAAPAAQAVDAERIVFRRESGGPNQIYVMRASDGFGQTKLSTSDTDEYDPAWSPDATQIAFGSVWELFGWTNPQVNVTNYDDFREGGTPPWPPPPFGPPYIYPYGLATSMGAFGYEAQNYSASWSPDGTRIAFTVTLDPDPPSGDPPPPEDIVGQIYAADSNSGSNRSGISLNAFNDFDPAWSPGSGELIAFASERGSEGAQVYVMRSDGLPFDDDDPETADDLHDGPKDIQLTTSTVAAEINFGPAWSPDGNRIAFTSTRDGNYEIYVMESDGSNPQRLTNNIAVDYAPTWSPDGTQIAFSSDRDQYFQIYAMADDGSEPRNLSNSNTNDYEPDWSPVPVPEPGAAAALATALAALLGLRAARRDAR